MRHSLTLFTIIMFNMIVSFAQNLVPNGDFEEYSDCGMSTSYPVPPLDKAVPWFSPTEGVPDYFNSCAEHDGFSTPNNGFGHQEPFNGTGYAGALLYLLEGSYSEHLAIQLIRPLMIGESYKVQFRFNLASISNCGINKMEIMLTDSPSINKSGSYQLLRSNEYPLVDTNGWDLFSVSFIATTTADYLIIGNFDDSLNLRDCISFSDEEAKPYSYYYIDGVSLIQENNYFLPDAFTPNGDGLNEIFRPEGINQEPEAYQLEVYNKWGKQVFETNDAAQGWDGTHAGEPLQQDVYIYKMSYEGFDQRAHQKSGRVTLLR